MIELLVVIAIIAILAAILFPVFARAREKARQASCQSNLKELMLAILMYVNDYDEKFPFFPWGEGYNGIPNSCVWFKACYPYIKNLQIFACPSRTQPVGVWNVWIGPPFDDPAFLVSVSGPTARVRMGYGYNEIIGNWGPWWGHTGLSLADIRYPAELVVLADCSSAWIGGYWASGNRGFLRRVAFASPRGDVGCGCPPRDSFFPPNAEEHTRHNGGSNIGFADGHVKWQHWNRCRTVSAGGGLRYYSWEW